MKILVTPNNFKLRVVQGTVHLFVVCVVLVVGFYSVLLTATNEISRRPDYRILQKEECAISSSVPLTKSAEKTTKPDVVVALLSSSLSCHKCYLHSDSEPADQPKIITGQVFTQFVSSYL